MLSTGAVKVGAWRRSNPIQSNAIQSNEMSEAHRNQQHQDTHLTHTDIDQRLGGRMGNLQQTHNGRTVVANRHAATVKDKLVHSSWPECSPYCLCYGLARIDIADQLGLAL